MTAPISNIITTADWITSLPPDLAKEIAEHPIDNIIATCRENFLKWAISQDIPKTKDGVLDHNDPQWLESCFAKAVESPAPDFPFSILLSQLSFSPLARAWNPHMNRGGNVISLSIAALNFGFHSSQLGPDMYHGSLSLLRLVLRKVSSADVWRKVFEIFAPAACPIAAPTSIHGVGATETPVTSATTRLSQTPVKANSGPSIMQSRTHSVLDPRIRAELDGHVFPSTPGFFEAYFPSRPETRAAYQASSVYRSEGGPWLEWPPQPTQAAVLTWFLQLTNKLLAANTYGARRYCSSPDRGLLGSASIRKPDLFLYPCWPFTSEASAASAQHGSQALDKNITYDWNKIHVVAELKMMYTSYPRSEVVVQLAGYVREIFITQHHRRFVHAFTLCRDSMTCWVFHRSGVLGSSQFNINENPQQFINVVVGYATMGYADLGYDTTLDFSPSGMEVGGVKLRVFEKPFFHTRSIASRGTICWDAVDLGQDKIEYVLKDSWRRANYPSEGLLFKKATSLHVSGIAEYVAHEDVMIDGVGDEIKGNVMKSLQVGKPMKMIFPPTGTLLDSPNLSASGISIGTSPIESPLLTAPLSSPDHTGRLSSSSSKRRALSDVTDQPIGSKKRNKGSIAAETGAVPDFDRIHTRIVTVKGRAIYTFSSPIELLEALYGATVGHQSLYTNGILHRDISINNILIATHPRTDRLKGFLIDLDHAIELEILQAGRAPHRTGTMEFMAIGALEACVHTYRHDLESFFYVFLWVCNNYALNGQRAPYKPTIAGWGGNDYNAAAIYKTGCMSPGRSGFDRILVGFEDWAESLKALATEWRNILFPMTDGGIWTGTDADEVPLYQAVLGLLLDTIQRLRV